MSTPCKIFGDIHGQFQDLLHMFKEMSKVIEGQGDTIISSNWNYLFLGDYINRGKMSVETITLLFCLKAKYPGRVKLLRGNHETGPVSSVYGFR